MTNAIHELRCREIVELVTDYLEGTMSAELRASFDAHLGSCDGCTHYLEQMQAMIRVAGTIEPAELSPDFRAGLLAAFGDFNPG
jgi:anti-sigma factor RsiW